MSHETGLYVFCGMCRFVIEASVEENVQRLSGQRAAAMNLSALASPGKQSSQKEPLTVRYGNIHICLIIVLVDTL